MSSTKPHTMIISPPRSPPNTLSVPPYIHTYSKPNIPLLLQVLIIVVIIIIIIIIITSRVTNASTCLRANYDLRTTSISIIIIIITSSNPTYSIAKS